MLKKTVKILFPLISAIIGLLLANYFNIFDYFTFVPNEHKYDVCITVYFAIVDILLTEAQEFAQKRVIPYVFSSVNIVFHPKAVEPDIKIVPTIQFNSLNIAEINMTVSITGKRSHFKNTKLVIPAPAFVDIQNNYKRDEVQVINNKYVLELEKLFGSSIDTHTTQTFTIILAQTPVDGESVTEVCPSIEHKKWCVRYAHNKANIKAVK